MKSRLVSVLVSLFLSSSLSAFAQGGGGDNTTVTYEVGRMLTLSFNSGVDDPTRQSIIANVGDIYAYYANVDIYVLHVKSALSPAQAKLNLQTNPSVLYAETENPGSGSSIPNDPYFGSSLVAGYPSQYGLLKIKATAAWDTWLPYQKTVLAVLDSGVDTTHPDLMNILLKENNVVVGKNFVPKDANNPNAPTDVTDRNGHGTHVAGIACAQINNGVGVAGLFGWTGLYNATGDPFVNLLPVRCLDHNRSF